MFNSLEISSFRWFLFEADVAIDIFKYEPNFFFLEASFSDFIKWIARGISILSQF